MSRPEVLLLATGGTIANPLDVEGYLSGRELLDGVPEVEEVADVEVVDVASTGSSGVTPEIWWALHAEIEAAAAREDPPDGVVVTHGSNTVEETAYFLHLTLRTDLPVTLTAAQRNHRLVGNDGDRNLVDAVKVATSDAARGRGALVVLNDEIHSAREATKSVTGRPDAWSSGNLGALGLIDKRDHCQFLRETEARHAPDAVVDLDGTDPGEFPRVEVVYSAAAMDGTMVRAAVDRGADGLVLAGLPTGSPADPTGWERTQADAVREATEEVPVALSTRASEGWPYRNRREQYGVLWGSTLSPQKARILLALGLMRTDDEAELQRLFEEY